jgi:FAD synthase
MQTSGKNDRNAHGESDPTNSKLLPPCGVYATMTRLVEDIIRVTNIGINPQSGKRNISGLRPISSI